MPPPLSAGRAPMRRVAASRHRRGRKLRVKPEHALPYPPDLGSGGDRHCLPRHPRNWPATSSWKKRERSIEGTASYQHRAGEDGVALVDLRVAVVRPICRCRSVIDKPGAEYLNVTPDKRPRPT